MDVYITDCHGGAPIGEYFSYAKGVVSSYEEVPMVKMGDGWVLPSYVASLVAEEKKFFPNELKSLFYQAGERKKLLLLHIDFIEKIDPLPLPMQVSVNRGRERFYYPSKGADWYSNDAILIALPKPILEKAIQQGHIDKLDCHIEDLLNYHGSFVRKSTFRENHPF